MEINHFEGSRPKWLVPKRILGFCQRAGLLEGERGSTYWCMPAILSLYFLSLLLIFPFLFLFLFFSPYLFPCCDFLLEVTITMIVIPLLCMAKVLYIVSVVIDFYYFSF